MFPGTMNGDDQMAKKPAKGKKSKELSDEELEILNK